MSNQNTSLFFQMNQVISDFDFDLVVEHFILYYTNKGVDLDGRFVVWDWNMI